jgi:hypothetical protein
MAEKTMVEKAGEAVGFGIAMAEDVAGAVKTAVGAAVTTVTEVLKKTPGDESSDQAGCPKSACDESARHEGFQETRDQDSE